MSSPEQQYFQWEPLDRQYALITIDIPEATFSALQHLGDEHQFPGATPEAALRMLGLGLEMETIEELTLSFPSGRQITTTPQELDRRVFAGINSLNL